MDLAIETSTSLAPFTPLLAQKRYARYLCGSDWRDRDRDRAPSAARSTMLRGDVTTYPTYGWFRAFRIGLQGSTLGSETSDSQNQKKNRNERNRNE